MIKMTDPEFKSLLEVLQESTPSERVEFLEWKDTDSQEIRANKFLLWWFYYFRHNFKGLLADFHYKWIYSLAWHKNILIKWLRWSIKTEIVKAYHIKCICDKQNSFKVWQSFDSWASEWHMRNMAKMLISKFIKNDYGELYKLSWPRDDLKKKSMWNWNTENGIRMSARSLGEKLRWEGEYEDTDDWSSRPDCLTLDDIDVSDSVRSVEIIDKNIAKITGETIGAMSKEKSRILFLWNVINQDGVVPRFENEKSNDPNWDVFVQKLFNEKLPSDIDFLQDTNLIPWDRITQDMITWDFFTVERIKKIHSNEWGKSFLQNYLLIPIIGGDLFFKSQERLIIPEWKADGKYPDIRIYRPSRSWLCIGVDTSKGWLTGDYSTVSVRDVQGNLFAFYRWHVPPDILHDEIINRIFELGYIGRLAIESNNTGIATINKAKEWKWKQYLYSEKVMDERTNRQTQKIGWNTNSKTRPLMLSEYEEAVRNWVIIEVDSRTKDEMQTFIYNDDFRPEASSQGYDDCIIADTISWQMRKFPSLSF